MSEEDRGSKRNAEVLRLSLVEGLSIRAIARRLSLGRKTVREILGRALSPRHKDAAPQRSSILDPYQDLIRGLVTETPEMRAPAVLERLRELGYQGGISVLRDRLQELRPRRSPEAFLTLDFQAGVAMQIDWADFGFALPGCPRRVSAFVMALCHSRYLYLEFALSQAMGTFLRCMERGLRFVGGTTHVDIFDNMKTVVRERTAHATVFNPALLEYAQSRGGFRIVACNPQRGNEKGRVERPIGFVRDRFWRGRRFRDLLDLNAQASDWRDRFANPRIHDTTGKVPALVFEHQERPQLKPLVETAFDTDDRLSARVTKSFRVAFDRNLYSVPWRLVSQTVLVRANDDAVSVFLGPKQVALHRRCWAVNQDIEHPSHRQGLLERKPQARAGSLPPSLLALGDTGARYFQVLAASRRSLAREAVRITYLVELFGQSATASAVDEVLRCGHVGAEYVEYVLRHKKGLTPNPPPLRLGDPFLDSLSFREPDLSIYDPAPAMTLDPGEPPMGSSEGDPGERD